MGSGLEETKMLVKAFGGRGRLVPFFTLAWRRCGAGTVRRHGFLDL